MSTDTTALDSALDMLISTVTWRTQIQSARAAAGHSTDVETALYDQQEEAETAVDAALATVKTITQRTSDACDCNDPCHSGTHLCSYCEHPTTNLEADNEWEDSRACDDCHAELDWRYTHSLQDCDPYDCDRDHDAEAREAHQDKLDDMRREET